MNTNRMLALGGVALALSITLVTGIQSVAADKSGEASERHPDALLARIEKLEARVAKLEGKQTSVVLPAPLAPKRIPKGWVPKTFNGREYFIVPLEGNKTLKNPAK